MRPPKDGQNTSRPFLGFLSAFPNSITLVFPMGSPKNGLMCYEHDQVSIIFASVVSCTVISFFDPKMQNKTEHCLSRDDCVVSEILPPGGDTDAGVEQKDPAEACED